MPDEVIDKDNFFLEDNQMYWLAKQEFAGRGTRACGGIMWAETLLGY